MIPVTPTGLNLTRALSFIITMGLIGIKKWQQHQPTKKKRPPHMPQNPHHNWPTLPLLQPNTGSNPQPPVLGAILVTVDHITVGEEMVT